MRELTADLLVGRLVDWGVDTVFGLPADGADGIVEAFASGTRAGTTQTSSSPSAAAAET